MVAAALLAGSALATAPAIAAPELVRVPPPPMADCSVVDLSPDAIAVGISLKARVTFDVGTDCDEDTDIHWNLDFDKPGPQTGPTGPRLTNTKPDPSSKRTYIPGGEYTWGAGGYAGVYNVRVGAWINEGQDLQYLGSDDEKRTLTILRRTTFGSTFNAYPEPRRAGSKMKITGKVKTANWQTKKYEGFATGVTLQFRPDGSDDYQDIKGVWTNGAAANTTVTVQQSGTWRYHYAGDPQNFIAASNSKGDRVVVTP